MSNYTPGAFQFTFTLEKPERIEKPTPTPGNENPSIHTAIVKAAKANTGVIFIGNAKETVDATHGFELGAGDAISMDVESLGDLAGFATKAGDKVHVFFVGP